MIDVRKTTEAKADKIFIIKQIRNDYIRIIQRV